MKQSAKIVFKQPAYLLVASVLMLLASNNSNAFYVSMTGPAANSDVGYYVNYNLTTEFARESSDPGYVTISDSKVHLIADTYHGETSSFTYDVDKGSSYFSPFTWTVVNQEHNMYVSWRGRISLFNHNSFTTTYMDSQATGPIHTY